MQIERINNNIKKIVNVFQLECIGGKKTAGLGDYLRGCFALMQLSKLLNIEFDLDISNHLVMILIMIYLSWLEKK